ncbi:MAG: hypothetical protein K0S32_2004 [Bacteroidetes bacterium]|jgi:hypothetical protein|nr:hypothetical protein [Bacteroidota bacterium]
MSLHFQIDFAFDFHENVPAEIIEGLEALFNNSALTRHQKQIIPELLQNEVKHLSDTTSFHGKDILYFKKRTRFTRNNIDIHKWSFHFRRMLVDDVFYEEGYKLIAWLAILSDTSGFVGYIKEELEKDPRLVYFENKEVIIQSKEKEDIRFNYSEFITSV